MKIAALISGGKDSLLAYSESKKLGYDIVYFICLFPKNKESYMFHSINLHIVKHIAYSCDIPLIYKETNGIKEKELEDLEQIFLHLKKYHQIDGICSGAIFSNYQKKRIDNICHSLNLISITPLWNKNSNILLNEIANTMDVRIVSVSADGFNESWLGKKITKESIKELNVMRKKYGINIIGEGGEFETIVLDAPYYKYKINILEFKKKWFTNYGYYLIQKISLEKK